MQSPKNSKKQKQLPPPGNKPEVVQAEVLSPHEIEKAYLLKTIKTFLRAVNERDKRIRLLLAKLDQRQKEIAQLDRSYHNALASAISTAEMMAWQAQYINDLVRGTSSAQKENHLRVAHSSLVKN